MKKTAEKTRKTTQFYYIYDCTVRFQQRNDELFVVYAKSERQARWLTNQGIRKIFDSFIPTIRCVDAFKRTTKVNSRNMGIKAPEQAPKIFYKKELLKI